MDDERTLTIGSASGKYLVAGVVVASVAMVCWAVSPTSGIKPFVFLLVLVAGLLAGAGMSVYREWWDANGLPVAVSGWLRAAALATVLFGLMVPTSVAIHRHSTGADSLAAASMAEDRRVNADGSDSSSSYSSTPEPSSLLVLICGAGSIGGVIWRSRRR